MTVCPNLLDWLTLLHLNTDLWDVFDQRATSKIIPTFFYLPGWQFASNLVDWPTLHRPTSPQINQEGSWKRQPQKIRDALRSEKKQDVKKIGSVGGVTPYQESWNHEKWMFEQKLGFHLNRIFHRYTYIHVSDFPLKSYNIALLYISRSFWIW